MIIREGQILGLGRNMFNERHNPPRSAAPRCCSTIWLAGIRSLLAGCRHHQFPNHRSGGSAVEERMAMPRKLMELIAGMCASEGLEPRTPSGP